MPVWQPQNWGRSSPSKKSIIEIIKTLNLKAK